MKDIKVEDTVILLDISRSMYRKDFKPNRLTVALETAKCFIENKLIIDPKDRISIIQSGISSKKLTSITYNSEYLINSLKKVKIMGRGVLHEAIAFSLHVLIGEMQRIGGKIPRIFIISDNKSDSNFEEDILKISNIAKGLGVFIDTCQIGHSPGSKVNNLKKIAQITNGEYGYFNNIKALINAGKSFASKKDIKKPNDYYSPEKDSEIAPLISQIALPLRRPTVLEFRSMMAEGNKGQEKCQICHSTKASSTGADFYSEGRYCPSCNRPMHFSCAAMWAAQSPFETQNVFRCPFCYFLLKIPDSVIKLVSETKKEIQKIRIIDENQTKMVKLPENEVEQIYASCSYCNSIFLGEVNVYQCEKCSSYYHEPCLEKMHEEIKACRYCGASIVF